MGYSFHRICPSAPYSFLLSIYNICSTSFPVHIAEASESCRKACKNHLAPVYNHVHIQRNTNQTHLFFLAQSIHRQVKSVIYCHQELNIQSVKLHRVQAQPLRLRHQVYAPYPANHVPSHHNARCCDMRSGFP